MSHALHTVQPPSHSNFSQLFEKTIVGTRFAIPYLTRHVRLTPSPAMTENQNMIALSNRTNRNTRLFEKRPESTVAQSAQKELEESPLFRSRSQLIRVDEHDGELVLEGRLPSFYLKQMLQTILQKLDGVEHIDNRVHVDYPKN